MLGNDALTGCLQGLGSVKSSTSPSWQQLGVTCAIGAGEGLLKGIGGLFGASSSSGSSTKSK